MSYWRQGEKVPINVYDGDRPVCQCHNEFDAREIVQAVNQKLVSMDQQSYPKGYKDYLDEIARVLHPDANERFAYVPDQLSGIVQRLKEAKDLADSHITNLKDYTLELKKQREDLKKERDQLISAVRALPLPD